MSYRPMTSNSMHIRGLGVSRGGGLTEEARQLQERKAALSAQYGPYGHPELLSPSQIHDLSWKKTWNGSRWVEKAKHRPPAPGNCLPDKYWPSAWNHPPGLINNNKNNVYWESSPGIRMHNLCKCIKGDMPTDEFGNALVTVPWVAQNAYSSQGSANEKWASYATGRRNSQERVDFCWTKALQTQGITGANRTVSYGDKKGGGMPSTLRAYKFPDPCKYLPATAADRMPKQGYGPPPPEGIDWKSGAFWGGMLPDGSDKRAMPFAPVPCSVVAKNHAKNLKARMGTFVRGSREPASPHNYLLNYVRSRPDLSVRVLQTNPEKGFREKLNRHPMQASTFNLMQRLRDLKVVREKSKLAYPILGLGAVIKPGDDSKGTAMLNNMKIAGVVAGTVGLLAFVHVFTGARK